MNDKAINIKPTAKDRIQARVYELAEELKPIFTVDGMDVYSMEGMANNAYVYTLDPEGNKVGLPEGTYELPDDTWVMIDGSSRIGAKGSF